MIAEDVMTRRVIACRVDTDLSHAARVMWENDCGAVPVVDGEDRLVGILTDRDVCMCAYFQGRTLRELVAAGCMAGDVASCRRTDPLTEVARLMGERAVRRIPVTDDAGRLVGILSVGDLLAAAARSGAREKKELHAALIEALTSITARASREVEAPLPARKGGASRPRKRARRAS